jgi:four helix bundle protein
LHKHKVVGRLSHRRWSLVLGRWSAKKEDDVRGAVMTRSSFKDLRVWHESMKLASEVYRLTAKFPRHEVYGLSQQMRRAAVSVPSNIAEGKGYRSDREFVNFLLHARGSLLELHTQVLIAEDLQYLLKDDALSLVERADGVGPKSEWIDKLTPRKGGITRQSKILEK